MTGPIYVNGAEPGDVLEIRILRIEPKPWAANFNLPGKDFPTIGALAAEMPEGYIKFFPIDLEKRASSSSRGSPSTCSRSPARSRSVSIPRSVSRKGGVKGRWRRYRRFVHGRTAPTWTSTSCRRAPRSISRCSSRVGLIWMGDSHCRQGNGEVNLTALECSYKGNQDPARSCART